MSQYGQVKKVLPFRTVPTLCVGSILQRLQTHQPPETHLSAYNFHKDHSDTLRHIPDIPQTTPDIAREHNMPTDYNRRQKTLPDTLKQQMAVSWGGVVVSRGVCCRFLACPVPWRWLRVVWGMFGGCSE